MSLADSRPVFTERSPLLAISEELFDAAVDRKAVLDEGALGGTIRYRMVDNQFGRIQILNGLPGGFTNCIHAVSDIVFTPGGNLLPTGGKNGLPASKAVFAHLKSSGALGSINFDDQLAPRLGI